MSAVDLQVSFWCYRLSIISFIDNSGKGTTADVAARIGKRRSGVMSVGMSAFLSAVMAAVMSVVMPRARPIVVVDPGHPSEVSSGAELQNGTTEVHTAWL